MKLISLLTAALLPIGLMAAPVAEESADLVIREAIDVSTNEPAGRLLKRNQQLCDIVNASVVNCRAGPGTSYKIVKQFKKGEWSAFTCYKSGECVTVSGSVNCGWDYTPYGGSTGCYVNGHYTDNSCTAARLSKC